MFYHTLAALSVLTTQGQLTEDDLVATGASLLPLASAARKGIKYADAKLEEGTLQQAYNNTVVLAGMLRSTENATRFTHFQYSGALAQVIIEAFLWLEDSVASGSAPSDSAGTLGLLKGVRTNLQNVIGRLLRLVWSLTNSPPGPKDVRFALAFLRTDSLSCVAMRVAALRECVGNISSNPLPDQLNLLSEGRATVQGAVELANAALEVHHPLIPFLTLERDTRMASSHLLENTCALFMSVIEQFAPVAALVAEALAPATARGSKPLVDLPRVLRQFRPLGSNLCHMAGDLLRLVVRLLIKSAGASLSTVTGPAAAETWGLRAPGNPHLLAALLHPAVQYFVGWAASGAGAETGAGARDGVSIRGSRSGVGGGGGAAGCRGVSVPLLRDLEADRRKLPPLHLLSCALVTSATLWSTALRGGALLVPPASTGAAVGLGASPAAGPDGGTGPAASAASPTARPLPLPYKPTKLYGMLLSMHQLSLRVLDALPHGGVEFVAGSSPEAGVEKGLAAPVECLLRLAPGPASRRLPVLWGTVVRQITYPSKQPDNVTYRPVYEAVGRLLRALAHLPAPGRMDDGNGHGRAVRPAAAPACRTARAVVGSAQSSTGSGRSDIGNGSGSASGSGSGDGSGSGGAGPSGDGPGAPAAPSQGGWHARMAARNIAP